MNPATLLPLALLTPMLAAALIVTVGSRPNLRDAVSVLAALALSACCFALLAAVAGGERPALVLVDLLPGAPLELAAEPLGAVFACLAASLWSVTSIYSIGYLRKKGDTEQTRFFAWLAVALGAVTGAALAGNLLTLFVFYELLTLSTWPLVTHGGSPAARRAGRIYLGILLGSSLGLLLLAVVWTHALAGHGQFVAGGALAPSIANGELSNTAAAVLFTMFGLGIGKAALMPLHGWLPAAMVAPAPVSALLHAVAVVKTGVFAVLKVAVYVFGIEGLRTTGAAVPIAWLAGFTVLAASSVALTRGNLKERLAWSTIGQLSYIVMGATSATPEGVIGASLHLVAHALGKITLFFAAGAIIVAAHRTRIESMVGLGRVMPFTFACFSIAALAIVGVPPLLGAWSKVWLCLGLATPENWPLLIALLLSSLLSAFYLLPVAFQAFRSTPPAGDDSEPATEAPLCCRIAIGMTAAACLLLVFALDPLQELLEEVVK
jgi:multicomponent Na+:H+ antiporter subunit D